MHCSSSVLMWARQGSSNGCVFAAIPMSVARPAVDDPLLILFSPGVRIRRIRPRQAHQLPASGARVACQHPSLAGPALGLYSTMVQKADDPREGRIPPGRSALSYRQGRKQAGRQMSGERKREMAYPSSSRFAAGR
ncbi:hypothetical protein B0T17DRAFT_502436 [Bombardia bombarda]|uniref:Uncharacterized protein n=1 Tax=Bombardia bombarda TaxID=252184 RepID=A0AA39XIW1_9PEZI|nr:hypothetical protein B0T17DRAFT_502436 [Bombardia bombarda]